MASRSSIRSMISAVDRARVHGAIISMANGSPPQAPGEHLGVPTPLEARVGGPRPLNKQHDRIGDRRLMKASVTGGSQASSRGCDSRIWRSVIGGERCRSVASPARSLLRGAVSGAEEAGSFG